MKAWLGFSFLKYAVGNMSFVMIWLSEHETFGCPPVTAAFKMAVVQYVRITAITGSARKGLSKYAFIFWIVLL